MKASQTLLEELEVEGGITRKFLERVPFDKADWQPHEKSEKLGRLAIHVAEIMAWWKSCVEDDYLDFIDFEPEDIDNTTDLLAYYDGLFAEAKKALTNAKDENLEGEWSMKYGDTIYFTMKKSLVARTFCMNHLIHHRAQLGVYLRLLGIPVPGAYGPTADEEFEM